MRPHSEEGDQQEAPKKARTSEGANHRNVCPQCAYDNDDEATSCSICDTALHPATAPPMSNIAATDKTVVCSTPTTTTPAVKRRAFLLPIAGSSHRSAALAKCNDDDALSLELQPDNAHDPNAIVIRSVATGEAIGYLPRAVAAVVTPVLRDGGVRVAAATLQQKYVVFMFDKAVPWNSTEELLAASRLVRLRNW